jgi:four helix bundle protein
MDKIQLQNRTKNFVLSVFKMVEKLSGSREVEVITYQLVKASTSVAANYRAVCRAKSINHKSEIIYLSINHGKCKDISC